MSVVFHRRWPSHRGYEVQGTCLLVARSHRGWRILSSEQTGREWLARNHVLLTNRFARLRDVREFLQALFETDPPMELQIAPVRLRKISPGRWDAVSGSGERYSIWRDGQSGYKLMRHVNGYVTHTPSLAAASSLLRRI